MIDKQLLCVMWKQVSGHYIEFSASPTVNILLTETSENGIELQ